MVHAHIVVTLWLMLEKYVADHGGLEGSLKKIDDIQYLGSLLRGYPVPTADDVYRRLSNVIPERAGKDEVFTYLANAVQSSLGPGSKQWTPSIRPCGSWNSRPSRTGISATNSMNRRMGKSLMHRGNRAFDAGRTTGDC